MFVQLCPRYLCVVLQASCFISSALLHVLMQRNTWWQKTLFDANSPISSPVNKSLNRDDSENTHQQHDRRHYYQCLFISGDLWDVRDVWCVSVGCNRCWSVCVCVSQRPERQTHLYLWSPTTWSHRDTHTSKPVCHSVYLFLSVCLCVILSVFLSVLI